MHRIPELGRRQRRPKADRDLARRLGIENIPGFRFSKAAMMRLGVIVIGMDLDRETLGSEQQLYQQRANAFVPWEGSSP